MKNWFVNFFKSPVTTRQQKAIIVLVAILFIWMPQLAPIDWNLNTQGFWSNFPDMYDAPDIVYPPWGLILMLPYWLMGAAGSRILSVITIGWLVTRQNWSLLKFFAIVLSPFF